MYFTVLQTLNLESFHSFHRFTIYLFAPKKVRGVVVVTFLFTFLYVNLWKIYVARRGGYPPPPPLMPRACHLPINNAVAGGELRGFRRALLIHIHCIIQRSGHAKQSLRHGWFCLSTSQKKIFQSISRSKYKDRHYTYVCMYLHWTLVDLTILTLDGFHLDKWMTNFNFIIMGI